MHQQQEQQQSYTGAQDNKADKWLWLRIACASITLFCIIGAALLFIHSAGSSLYNIMGAFFSILAALFAFVALQPVLFPSKKDPITVIIQPDRFPREVVSAPDDSANKGGKQSQKPRNAKTPTDIPTSIFPYLTPHLPATSEYYARARERIILLDRTRKEESTSIIGPRRMGKTWLIDYLKLVAPAQLGECYHIATIDGTMPNCKTVSDFTVRILEAFKVPLISVNQAKLGLDALEKVVREWKAGGVTPVLCIDEFEGFFNQRDFDCEFYGGLRYIAQNGLVLVIASKSPLIALVGDRCEASGFFNIFHQLTLKPFDKVEAEEFASAKSREAAFNDAERAYLLKYGQEPLSGNDEQQWPPLRLQLVGKTMLTDINLAREGQSHYYRPNDEDYWRDFEKRVQETYRGAVH